MPAMRYHYVDICRAHVQVVVLDTRADASHDIIWVEEAATHSNAVIRPDLCPDHKTPIWAITG